MAPIHRAFQALWPQAVLHNLFDDRLAPDLEAAGQLTPDLRGRIDALGRLGIAAGADGVLYTCSAFAEAIEATAAVAPVPVLKPDEAMFAQALACGRRIGLLATFAPAVAGTQQAFLRQARAAGVDAQLETVCVPEAMTAARAGDIAGHNQLVAGAVPRLQHCDAIMLAHFSTSTALQDAQQASTRPVLSAPEAAVRELKQRIQARS
jgi:aspartate/glutamate racemase